MVRVPDEPHWAELYGRLSIEEHDQQIMDMLVPRIRERRRQRSFIILLENLNHVLEVQFRVSRHAGSTVCRPGRFFRHLAGDEHHAGRAAEAAVPDRILCRVGSEAEKAAERRRLARLHAGDSNWGRVQRYLPEVWRLPLEGMGQC